MATASISVIQSTHDGTATWNQRANANGTVFTGGLVSPIIGPHLNFDLVYASFFILKVDNIPQGSTINNCKLEIRTNNAYTGGLTNHIYVAVENNLDPTGTGAILNGTLGSQPWQRLGRQSAATTLLGNRCGPTHNQAGQTLSSYGAHVRDPSALIYKAFCTAQGTAATVGRDLPAASWVQTEDFAPALQPLVNDAGWNGTTQYVMVWLFSDINTGTTFNIGSLSGFTWSNGTVGASTTYGNGGGQVHYYDAGPGTYPPRMLLDYTVTSLRSQNTYSSSSGYVRLSPPQLLGRMRGERSEPTAGNAVVPVLSTGAHDLPITGMAGVANPNDAGWFNGNPNAARVKWGTQRTGRVDGSSLFVEDYANNTPRVWWDIGKYQSRFTTRDVYSLRFYHRYERNTILNSNAIVARFYLAGVESFRIEHQQYIAGSPEYGMELRIASSGGNSAWTSYRFNSPAGQSFYRYEIQVDASQTPKVRVRVYLDDSTTPLAVLTYSPTTVEMDQVIFGDYQGDAFYYFSFRIADFEAWSDYRLNGQYPDTTANTGGTPYIPQQLTWFEYNGSNSEQLDDLGTVSTINPDGSSVVMTTPSAALTNEDYSGEVWAGTSTPYTAHYNLSYGTGNYRQLDLFVPNGTPPAGGWPVIMYTHGGFWIAGGRNTIPTHLIADCALRGYAVASCSYVLAQIYLNDGTAWNPSSTTGRYPTFILNYKEAAYWLKTTGASTYNLNPTKFVATGHSAGGYNALGAVVSRGITNDGSGRNLTLAGNVVAYGCPNVADPTFLGAYIWAGPVDLTALKAWDPTYPNWPYAGTGVGTITVTARSFLGNKFDTGGSDVTNCNLDAMVVSNAANIPSVCYAWGCSDHLVVSAPFTPHSQQAKLAAAFAAAAGSLPPTTTYEGHQVPDALHHTIHDNDLDHDHFFNWLRNLPGL